MSETLKESYYDDFSKLESKVVLALSRLRTNNRCSTRQGKFQGVDRKQVVEYLSAHYHYLDGDIESQVITALLSCVKNGTICALENGKYQLIGPGSKTIISNCLTRASHGPKCYCLKVLESLHTKAAYTCCYLKKGAEKPKKVIRTLPKRKKRSPRTRKRRLRRGSVLPRKTRSSCLQKEEKTLDDTCSNCQTKCSFCQEVHPSPTDKKDKLLCKTCHPFGVKFAIPLDKFSPREGIL